ncbi:MAG: hypothetical protein ACRD1T_26885, partial [Acidimicrobiia bacterium]
ALLSIGYRIKSEAAKPKLTDASLVLLGPARKGGIGVRIILVALALAAVLSLFPAVFETAGDIVPGGDAAIRVDRIAGDIAPGGS